ncbi:MAG: tRNA (adenosine(37)-N6)-threonylcarbamoyltransferase complex dimerization subunit type 1 TsaB [Clostridia bacterium]|nr:tRNA (adenosine(37)-N6)-threonylcarbamoyltransferase complex dimerization subunit type 1 TsaB [Clostridia bacterium]
MKHKELNDTLCLCIDTSSHSASVAIGKSENGKDVQILCSILLNDGFTHSEKILPMIDQCLSACRLEAKDIDIYACINGPGSFTGLRIGISTINAMAQSTDALAAGINTLEAAAYGFRYFDGIIVPMIDARRDEAYTCTYKAGGRLIKSSDDSMKNVDDLINDLSITEGKLLFAGYGAYKARERAEKELKGRAMFIDDAMVYSRASAGAEIALKRYYSVDGLKKEPIMANYIKDTSAKTIAERSSEK